MPANYGRVLYINRSPGSAGAFPNLSAARGDQLNARPGAAIQALTPANQRGARLSMRTQRMPPSDHGNISVDGGTVAGAAWAEHHRGKVHVGGPRVRWLFQARLRCSRVRSIPFLRCLDGDEARGNKVRRYSLHGHEERFHKTIAPPLRWSMTASRLTSKRYPHHCLWGSPGEAARDRFEGESVAKPSAHSAPALPQNAGNNRSSV